MRLLKISQCALLAGGLLALSACNAQDAGTADSAAAPSATLATVNGSAIPQSRLELLAKERAAQGQPDSPEMRKALREDLINREIIAQEATKKGLDKNSDVSTKIELARQAVLIQAYLQDHIKNNPLTDDALKAEFEKIKGQMGDKEYRAHHILVESQDEAKSIIAQLKKGAKFDKLAKQKSKDPGSKENGGELDWSPPNAYVKPFADALLKLKKGEYTQEPVQSQFGWHVIKLDDERAMQAPPFESVKQELQQRMQQQLIEKTIGALRDKAKIE